VTGQLVLHHGGAALGAALQSGGVREAAAAIPSAPARAALLHAYRVGFSQTFNELMVIGAGVAIIGAVCTFALVRQKDFVYNEVGTPRGETAGEGQAGAAAQERQPEWVEPSPAG
jgi:hypothetical protein